MYLLCHAALPDCYRFEMGHCRFVWSSCSLRCCRAESRLQKAAHPASLQPREFAATRSGRVRGSLLGSGGHCVPRESLVRHASAGYPASARQPGRVASANSTSVHQHAAPRARVRPPDQEHFQQVHKSPHAASANYRPGQRPAARKSARAEINARTGRA